MENSSVVTALRNGIRLVLTVGLKIHGTLLTGEVSLLAFFFLKPFGFNIYDILVRSS